MSVVTPHRAIKAVEDSKGDVRHIIHKMVGDLSGIEIIGDMVLVATYIRRVAKTAGGIWLPDSSKQEDVWQGKAGLVLKWGPDAFRDPDSGEVYEQNVAPGEWCVFKVGDGWQVGLRDYPCRLVRDVSIKMKISDPDIIL